MQWRTFDQGIIPQNEVFLLCIDDDVFFAKASGDRLVTKSCYGDARDLKEHGIRARGAEIAWFLQNLEYRKVTAKWCHFHKPGS